MSKVYSKIKDKSSEIEKEIYLIADGVCCSLFSIQSLATILHNNGIDNKQLSSRLGKRAKLKKNQYQLQPLNFCRKSNKEKKPMKINKVINAKLHRVIHKNESVTYASASGTTVISREQAYKSLALDNDEFQDLQKMSVDLAVYKWVLNELIKAEEMS